MVWLGHMVSFFENMQDYYYTIICVRMPSIILGFNRYQLESFGNQFYDVQDYY